MFSNQFFPLLLCLLVLEQHRVESELETDSIAKKLCERLWSHNRLTVPELKAALLKDTKDVKSRICLSLSLYDEKSITESRSEIIKLDTFAVESTADKYFVGGRFKKAFKLYTETIIKIDEFSAESTSSQGENDRDTGYFRDSASMTNPEWSQCLWTYWIEALWNGGYENEAKEEMRQRLNHFQLAVLGSRFIAKKKFQDAIMFLTEAMVKESSISSYYVLRGHCHQNLGAPDKADEDFLLSKGGFRN